MGGGSWTRDVYDKVQTTKATTGQDTFTYDSYVRSSGVSKVHDTLDPKWLNSNKQKVRESRDSYDHPETTPVAVFLDVTGTMNAVVRTLHAKIPQLLEILLRKGYLEHPQVLFGAIGDAGMGDRVPLQIGQFESDNRMDENLENVYLEGGGGGNKHESYDLALYFMARHTELDCVDRGQRGYMFIIGDEMPYEFVRREHVADIIGDNLESNIPIRDIVKEVQQKFELFYILPEGASYTGDKEVLGAWRDLLGENVLELSDPSAVSETIALTIGLREGVVDLDDGLADLQDVGSTSSAIMSASTAVATVSGGSAVAKSTATVPDLVRTGAKRVQRV